MSTTQADIRGWLKEGKRRKATHVIIVCDTFDYDDYPVYVKATEDVREIERRYNGQNMQRVVEVYSFKFDIETQLAEHRAFHYD